MSDGERGRTPQAQSTYDTALAALRAALMPQIIVFNVDALWPYRVADCHDATEPPSNPHPEVDGLLAVLHSRGVKMVSLTSPATLSTARALLEHYGWAGYVGVHELDSSGDAAAPLAVLRERLGVPYTAMLLLDHDRSRVKAAAARGVTAVVVPDGISVRVMRSALDSHSNKDLEDRGF